MALKTLKLSTRLKQQERKALRSSGESNQRRKSDPNTAKSNQAQSNEKPMCSHYMNKRCENDEDDDEDNDE